MSMKFNANQNLGGIFSRSRKFQAESRNVQQQRPTVQEQIVEKQAQPDVREKQLERAKNETSDTSSKGRATKEEGAKQFSDSVRDKGKKLDSKKTRRFSRSANAKSLSSGAKSGQAQQSSGSQQMGGLDKASQNQEAQQNQSASKQLGSQSDLAKLSQQSVKSFAERKPSPKGKNIQMVKNLAKWAGDEVNQFVRSSDNIYTKTGAKKIAHALNNMYGSLVSKAVASNGAAPTSGSGKTKKGSSRDDNRSEVWTEARTEMQQGVLAKVAAIFEKPAPPEGYVPLGNLVA